MLNFILDHFKTNTRRFLCRKFVGLMAAICLSVVSASEASQGMCSALFPEPTRYLDVNDDNSQFYIDGLAVDYISNSGRENIYIFRAQEGKQSYIYKLAGLSTTKKAEVLAGIRLGAEYGAPQIYESGEITHSSKIRNRGTVTYFKIETLFPHEKFITIKDSGLHSNDPKALKMIDEISDSFIRMAKDGVAAVDPDVAYTSDFKWRWIDADLWKKNTPDKIAYQISQFTRYLDNDMATYFSLKIDEKSQSVSAEFADEVKKHLSFYLK